MNSYYSQEELKDIGFRSIGKNVRVSKKASIYSPEEISIGSDVRIDDFVVLSGRIAIGSVVHIAVFSCLFGGNVGIYLDDNVNISSRVSIYAISDDYSGEYLTSPLVPEKYKNTIESPVRIHKHTIIGATSVILPGVTLGEGTSCGSFSLINSSTEEFTIYAGIPAKKVKERKRDLLNLEKKWTIERNQNDSNLDF